MALPISRYVDITSGVGGASAVSTRNLSGLVVTNNPLCPTGIFKTFASAEDVGTFFGFASEEYARAQFYFGWTSKSAQVPTQLSFWFWNNDAATADLIYGAPASYSLSTFTAISAGELLLTMGGHTHTLTGIDLSGAGSLAAVATDITTAINAYSAGGAAWTGAVVSFDATAGRFNLVGGATGADTIAVAAAVSNDIAGPLGWLLPTAVLSNGTAAQLLPANLTQLDQTDNNFGSFCFCTTYATLANIESAAAWNRGLTPNVRYAQSASVTPANAVTLQTAIAGVGGTGITVLPLVNPAGQYPEMEPMMIFSATNYNQPNSVQNYEFQEFNVAPAVTDTATADAYDAISINYNGQIQQAGQFKTFYQQGVLQGLATDPLDWNVYANEIWLKDALAVALMSLLLALPQLPANAAGVSLVLSNMQPILTQAKDNGVISAGKPLTQTQISYINTVSGTSTAWQQVQNQGYWVTAAVITYVVAGVTKYKIVYTLIYSKDDVIRKIEGTDILI